MRLTLVLLSSTLVTLSSSAPQRFSFGFGNRGGQRRSQNVALNKNSPNTRFFTGNQAIDSAAWGAALGAGTQYFANQVFNPCRNGNRNTGRPTNNRIFGNPAVTNGILGALGGFAAASVLHNAAGSPCG